MTASSLPFSIRSAADDIVHDTFHPLINKGLVDSYIQAGSSTSDFLLPDNLVMRVKQERNYVFYHVFRAEGVRR